MLLVVVTSGANVVDTIFGVTLAGNCRIVFRKFDAGELFDNGCNDGLALLDRKEAFRVVCLLSVVCALVD